jgi:tyrosyl-tRNA synthetase
MPNHAGQAARLARNAVDVLPEGTLADQLDAGRPLRVKLGIDPTAPDIHLGHTVVLTKLREFQEAGHTVVLIIGDFTARVGDPSGRSAQRPILEPEEIDANARTFTEQAFKVLDPEGTEVRFNSEWLRMPAEELFGLLGKATVAQITERDDFSKRLAAGTPVSLLELLYPVLQGYDSVAVKADVELGGTDQKFNLLLARDIQSAQGMRPQSVLTMPILPGTDGVQRMSKSAGNYVGVTDSPEEMFGKLMRIPDSAMPEYFRLLVEPAAAGETAWEDLPANEAKRLLGRTIVTRFWGSPQAESAEEHFNRLFVRHEPPADVEEVVVEGGSGDVHLPAVLADGFGLSRSEARRLLGQGGVKLDGQPLGAEDIDVDSVRLDGKILQVGKRRHKRVRVG